MNSEKYIPASQRKKNQSPSHQLLGHMALRWLGNRATRRGIRGAVEIEIEDWKKADAVAFGSLQLRFCERYSVPREVPYGTIGWYGSGALLFVFESKASLADFRNDFPPCNILAPKQPGHLRWVVIDFDLPIGEFPYGWGILKASHRGLSEIKKPEFKKPRHAQISSAYESLVWHGSYRERLAYLPCPCPEYGKE